MRLGGRGGEGFWGGGGEVGVGMNNACMSRGGECDCDGDGCCW